MMNILDTLNAGSMEQAYKKAREIEWNVMMGKKEYPSKMVRAASVMITRFDLMETLDIEMESKYEFV